MGDLQLAAAACRVAADLPTTTLEMLARWIAASTDLTAARGAVAQFPHPHYRTVVLGFLAACEDTVPQPSTAAASLALRTACYSEQAHRDEQSVELVWTGPDSDTVPLRKTEQAILEVLDSA